MWSERGFNINGSHPVLRLVAGIFSSVLRSQCFGLLLTFQRDLNVF